LRLLLVSLFFLVMVALGGLHSGIPEDLGSRAALVFGFLMLSGFVVGELAAKRQIPRITGYLLAGMACGPSLLALVNREVIEHLRLVDDLALALIALTAGAELKTSRLRARARSIASVTLVQTALVFVATGLGLWLLRPLLTFCHGLASAQVLAVIAVLALIATATSPSTAVAVIIEARSKGDITDTVLGTTVLKDIVVLVGFSLVMSTALPLFSQSGTSQVSTVGGVLLEVPLSLGMGAAFGVLMILYLRFVGRQRMLFIVACAFLSIHLSRTFHLDHLLVAVAAGFTVSNFSRQGAIFLSGLESAAGPVFLIFFCLAGAGLNLKVFLSVWQIALIFILLRGLFTYIGTAAGAALVRDPPSVRRLAWTGFIGQAGVSLGLATLARKSLGLPGAYIADLIVGAIVINQLVGPVAFRWALLRSGEGKRES
jgi:Kef-type K+ transport system membrane component KefB